MRHIPEDELHAYLDQALSRSQCAEIERHLAACASCQALRDEVAALRDRTTAILAPLGPELVIPPPYERLVQAFAGRRDRRRWIRRGVWAATVLVAAGAGWRANRWVHGPGAPAPVLAPARAAAVRPSATPAPDTARTARPEAAWDAAAAGGTPPAASAAAARSSARARRETRVEGRLVQAGTPQRAAPAGFEALFGASPVSAEREGRSPDDFPELEVSGLAAQPATHDPVPAGLWRTVVPDTFGAAVAAEVPRVPGLPVLSWRVQPGEPGQDVNAVDQLLENGQIIRTISGPADRVASLLAEAAEQAGGNPAEIPPDRMTVTVRQGERMLAITGPAHVLGSLLQRVSGPRRY